MNPHNFFFLVIVLHFLQAPGHTSLITGSWAEDLHPRGVGNFPLIPNGEAEYVFGWSNLPAGRAKFRFQRTSNREYKAQFSGASTGWVRTLWQADVTHETRGRLKNLQTLWFRQLEQYRGYRIEIEAKFTPEGARHIRQRTPSPDVAKWQSFHLPGLRDILGAMLFIRSQPLNPGDEIVTLCHSGDAPYLVRINVAGNENIRWQGKKNSAIRLDINLQRIETRRAERGQLRPHRRFRSGSVWLSNSKHRIPLRAEVSIFVGFVYVELIAWREK